MKTTRRLRSGSFARQLGIGLLSLATSTLAAQPARAPVKIAILDFGVNALLMSEAERQSVRDYGPAFAEVLTAVWQAAGDTLLVERRRLDAVLAERQLQAEQFGGDQAAAQLGRLLGASHILFGGVQFERGREHLNVIVTSRLVETSTGKLVGGRVLRGREFDLLDDLTDRLSDSIRVMLRLPQLRREPAATPSDARRRYTDDEYRRASAALAAPLQFERRGERAEAAALWEQIAADSRTPDRVRAAARQRARGGESGG
ncbi:MAG: CsgG/HfaB family protein [Gemmatimonadaceae bacterium]|jgi:hypothetical protein|nr:CsgG/HfaB family protein [Gemmatimonadaceae bacterium]